MSTKREKQTITKEDVGVLKPPAKSEKVMRSLKRDIEAEHDRIEDELASLKEEYERIQEQIKPLEEELRKVEEKMDKLKEPAVTLRYQLAELQAGSKEPVEESV